MMMNQQQQQQQLHPPHQQLQQLQQQQLEPDGKHKRNPYCSRCRNHGKSAQVKGHKRHCEYRNCQCEGCKLVECRQIVSAAQIKRRRYQKQDEECGRRIEISPPVLTRAAQSDSATLIAKTLINSKQSQLSSTKQFAAAVAAATAVGSATPTATAMAAVSQHAHEQLQMHMGGNVPAAFRGAVGPAVTSAAAAISASSTASTTLASAWPQPTPQLLRSHLLPVTSACQHLLHLDTNQQHTITSGAHHHLGSMASRLGPPLANGGALVSTTSGVGATPPQPPPPLMINQQFASPHLPDQTRTSCSGGPNLKDALHLFHFHHPSSVFSGAAFVHPGGGVGASHLQLPQLPNQPPPPPYSHLNCNHNSDPALTALKVGGGSAGEHDGAGGGPDSNGASSVLADRSTSELTSAASRLCPPTSKSSSPTIQSHSSREQLNLVKEIHRSFGPLVVYAWLRSERFNVAKVRALIDMAEDSFDELLQVNGHSPLDLSSPIVD